MAGAYSTNLRGRVMAGVEAGERVDAVAQRFAAWRSTAFPLVRAVYFGCERARLSCRPSRLTCPTGLALRVRWHDA